MPEVEEVPPPKVILVKTENVDNSMVPRALLSSLLLPRMNAEINACV